MNILATGYPKKPFHHHGGSAAYVPDGSLKEATAFLADVLTDTRGISMIHGQASSGKTTVCHRFVSELDPDIAVAMVDGAGLSSTMFFSKILSQFHHEYSSDSAEYLLDKIELFAVQQTHSNQAPLVVIKNMDEMLPDALQAICKLAGLKMHYRFALKFILMSTRSSYSLLQSSAMNPIAKRLCGVFEMTKKSPTIYRVALCSGD